MNDERVSQHYTRGDLAAAIDAGLAALGKAPSALGLEDLAPVDEFHIGGRPATLHLVEQLGLRAGQKVLDVGSGLGGASRFVAASYGSRVTGVDLTPEFCAVARNLAGRLGMAESVRYEQANALELPFPDGAFDAAYMLHVGMNVADKLALCREVARVLVPGGRFGVYDVLRGDNPAPLTFPVPWARSEETSFLASPAEMRSALEEAGFAVEHTEDRGAFAVEFFERLRGAGGPPPLGLHLVMGPEFRTKVANMVANVSDGRCSPWELVGRR